MNQFRGLLLLFSILVVCEWCWTVEAFLPSTPSLLAPKTSNALFARGSRTSFIFLNPFTTQSKPSPTATATALFQSEQKLSTDSNSSAKTSISDTFAAIKANIENGEFGKRGEIYFVLQLVLVCCILFDTIPIFGEMVEFILGPGFVLIGGSVATVGVVELGVNLTPWPSPPKDGSLVTDGLVFNQIRHPIYAGLIFLMFGLSMWSGSAMRVLLCAILWYFLDFKSELEEDELIRKFGTEYINYKERVTGKFVPSKLTDGIEKATNIMARKDDTAKVEVDEGGFD